MTKNILFYEQLGWIGLWNNVKESAFSTLFTEGKAFLSTGIESARYVFSTYGNWDNFDSNKSDNNNVAARVNKNDDNKNIGGLPNDLYKLYSI